MGNITIQISEKEFEGVMEAYQTLQSFFGEIISPNELYQTGFLKGIKEAQDEAGSGQLEEVNSFGEFVQ
ncbi:MAG: hypothetical protein ACUZ8O_15745 [Candidatus Anammoxibacter sp.]